MNKKTLSLLALAAVVLTIVVYFLPPVRGRVDSRIQQGVTELRYWLNPPEEVLFVPQTAALPTVHPIAQIQPTPTLDPTVAATFTPIPTLESTSSEQVSVQSSPTAVLPAPTATATPFVIVDSTVIDGIDFQTQRGVWNYCGPTNVAMMTSFWGETRSREDVGGVLRGSLTRVDDKNVSPAEMVSYVQEETDLNALMRSGGDFLLLKRLLTAGFPVIIEKGYTLAGEGWMGHYLLINGYDDTAGTFTTQDSYAGADTIVTYEETQEAWRAFNYTFIVIYPPDRESEMLAALGEYVDPVWASGRALAIAQQEVQTLEGQEQFFAQFNVGTALGELQQYGDAAGAFDVAFGLYARLASGVRPWRMMWYQTAPYDAYYHAGRYQDVINLADTTLTIMHEPILEETFYWRGMAHLALENGSVGRRDLSTAVSLNPNYAPAVAQLALLGP